MADTVRSCLEALVENSQGKVNYDSWRFKLNLTLKTKKIFKVATGVEMKPDGPETAETVVAWESKDLEAQTLIGLNCSSNIAKKIANCTTAYAMLQKLDTLYGKRSDVTVEGLQRQFFGYKYNESKSVIENCMHIQELADSLSTEGEEVKESWIMQRVLAILPVKFQHFRPAWDNVSAADKNLSTLFDRLRLEEDRLTDSEPVKSLPQNALVAKQVNKSGNKNSKSLECYKCGKRGHVISECRGKPCEKYFEYIKNKFGCKICKEKSHLARDCPEKNKESQSNARNSTDRRALITVGLSAASFSKLSSENYKNIWIQDSGATQHMCHRKEWFSNYEELAEPVMVLIGNGSELEGIGVGDIELEAYDNKNWRKVVLQNVLFTPHMPFNLFSALTVLKRGYKQEADAEKSFFKDREGNIVVVAVNENNLFKLQFRLENSVLQSRLDDAEKCLVSVSIKKWHEKLAHQNIKYVREILKRNDIKYIDDWNDYVCPGCVYGKQHRVSHPLNPKVSSRPLDLIHVDLCEMDVYSLGGAKYFLLFKDDYSHYRTVYFLKSKDEAFKNLENFIKLVENQFERRVKILRSDHGTEIKNKVTKEFIENLGIFHSKSSTYTPQQNGRVEREMRTVVESARSVIHAKDLDVKLWAEAVNYVVFTLNQTGTSTVDSKSPAELWFGRKMNVSKLKTFGCICYVYIEDDKRGKIAKKSVEGIFVGYDLDSPGFRAFVVSKNDVVSSSNVTFDESNETESFSELNIQTCVENQDDKEESNESAQEESSSSSSSESQSENETENEPRIYNLRNRRNINPPERYSENKIYSAFVMQKQESQMSGEVKISVQEALKNIRWKKAMEDEYRSLTDMGTWTKIKKPENIKPLTCRWVFCIKEDGRYKARLVIRGFEQVEGLDYYEIFSPVAHHMSIRLILSIAASEGMKLMTFDVKTAFLHGDLEENIYMYQPEGFNDNSSFVCKLKKSLYGLKQAPKNWNNKFTSFLKTLDFESTDDDPCVFYNTDKSIIIVLHVDDGLIAGNDTKKMLNILNKLHKEFTITHSKIEEKELSYLGMQIKVSKNEIFVSQSRYAEKILLRFNEIFGEIYPAHTPIERGMITNPENFVNDKPLSKTVPYRQAIGSLLYLAIISRPDISFAVNYFSRFNSKPMVSHWKMVKRIFQYIKATSNFGIVFNGEKELSSYSDSDYAGDEETKESTSGILVLRGGPVVWCTQKQGIVSNSTAEAEYRAAVAVIDELSWLRRLASELNKLDMNKRTKLYVDNQSAIHMLDNTHQGKITKGKKHIEIPRKFIQYHMDNTIEVQHVRSEGQLADIFTKPLSRNIFERLRIKIIKEEC